MPTATYAELLGQDTQGDVTHYQLFIPRSLVHFEGHFPAAPILPGLVQIQWAVDYASKKTGRTRVKQINRLKFSSLIFPDSKLTLSIHHYPGNARADFYYRHRHDERDITYSQGQLLYRD